MLCHNQVCTADSAGSQRIVSTSRDNTLRIWDAKKGLAPGPVMKHNNNTGRWISPFRAVWAPAADAIVVGNMGRQVLACLSAALCMITENQQDAEALCWQSGTMCSCSSDVSSLPERAKCSQVDIFDEKGGQAGAHSSDLMTAIPSRCTVHTSLPLLAAATASGRVHVYR
jgi:WD repeat-containing protein 76